MKIVILSLCAVLAFAEPEPFFPRGSRFKSHRVTDYNQKAYDLPWPAVRDNLPITTNPREKVKQQQQQVKQQQQQLTTYPTTQYNTYPFRKYSTFLNSYYNTYPFSYTRSYPTYSYPTYYSSYFPRSYVRFGREAGDMPEMVPQEEQMNEQMMQEKEM